MPDLQALPDRPEIAELFARYARGVDTNHWELSKSVEKNVWFHNRPGGEPTG